MLTPSRECLCSEFSLAQQKRTKEGLGPVLAGQRGSAHRADMKMSGFIRQRRGKLGEDGNPDAEGGGATASVQSLIFIEKVGTYKAVPSFVRLPHWHPENAPMRVKITWQKRSVDFYGWCSVWLKVLL